MFAHPTNISSERQWNPIPNAWGHKWCPQGPVIGPILFVIYVNDLPDRLSADSLLYADDIKLIAPRNRHDILQNSLNISASRSKDWELDLNPTNNEHLPIDNSPHFATYTLLSHNPLDTQTISPVSTAKDTTWIHALMCERSYMRVRKGSIWKS